MVFFKQVKLIHKSLLKRHHIDTLYIEPGICWENGHIESFNGKLRDKLLKRIPLKPEPELLSKKLIILPNS